MNEIDQWQQIAKERLDSVAKALALKEQYRVENEKLKADLKWWQDACNQKMHLIGGLAEALLESNEALARWVNGDHDDDEVHLSDAPIVLRSREAWKRAKEATQTNPHP